MDQSRFPALLGYVGALGGVAIALGLPWLVLVYGSDFSAGLRALVIVLALLVGATLAVASTVVGIAVPRAARMGTLDIGRYADACCEGESAQAKQASTRDAG